MTRLGLPDRFTRESRTTRGKIPKWMRLAIFERDDNVCQYCDRAFPSQEMTIDHIIPLAAGGVDEVWNYVTCCAPCNGAKAATSIPTFAAMAGIELTDLPVHGDPIIDNKSLPPHVRLLRKKIFDRVRSGHIRASGRSAQKKIEKAYRREFWQTDEGKKLQEEWPSLPGHVRASLPEIESLATNESSFRLLIELAKSANTRNLISAHLVDVTDVEATVRRLAIDERREPALRKRLNQALSRHEREMRRRAGGEAIAEEADDGDDY